MSMAEDKGDLLANAVLRANAALLIYQTDLAQSTLHSRLDSAD